MRSWAGRWPGAVIRARNTLTISVSDSKMLPSPPPSPGFSWVLAFQTRKDVLLLSSCTPRRAAAAKRHSVPLSRFWFGFFFVFLGCYSYLASGADTIGSPDMET